MKETLLKVTIFVLFVACIVGGIYFLGRSSDKIEGTEKALLTNQLVLPTDAELKNTLVTESSLEKELKELDSSMGNIEKELKVDKDITGWELFWLIICIDVAIDLLIIGIFLFVWLIKVALFGRC